MKYIKNNNAFTLVELLVVITILAVISVVAYTNFSGTTDKAKNSKKIADIASIETALQTFNQEKNYFPMPSQYSGVVPKNLWGYSGAVDAQVNNTLDYLKPAGDLEISSVTSGAGGGKVNAGGSQIGAKGTFDADTLPKQYLSQTLLDPSVKDIKVGATETLKDYGVGEYVYGVYAKNNTTWNNTSTKGSAYNLAVTIKDEQKGGFTTKLVGNFDKNTCVSCPDSLIGSGVTSGANLKDGDFSTTGSGANEKVPYPIEF